MWKFISPDFLPWQCLPWWWTMSSYHQWCRCSFHGGSSDWRGHYCGAGTRLQRFELGSETTHVTMTTNNFQNTNSWSLVWDTQQKQSCLLWKPPLLWAYLRRVRFEDGCHELPYQPHWTQSRHLICFSPALPELRQTKWGKKWDHRNQSIHKNKYI